MPIASCPSCATRLTVPDNLAPDKAIRCPKCQTVFRPAEEPLPAAAVGAYQEPAPPRPRAEPVLLEDEDFRDRDQPPRPSGPRRRRSRAWLWISLSAACVLLVAGVVFAVFFWKRGSGFSDELKYAPDGTRLVVSFDAQAIRNSSAGAKLYKAVKDTISNA